MSENLIGRRSHRLTVIAKAPDRPVTYGSTYWRCRCDCGREKDVSRGNLLGGKVRSCGCLRNERVAETLGKPAPVKSLPEYRVWASMRARCLTSTHPAYASYGGRGITVCDRWRDSFAAFLEDMGRRPGPDHSLDRIDNDGPYAPGNCRWATMAQQGSNRRTNRFVEFRGERLTIAAWARRIGIAKSSLRHRLDSGWSVEDALTRPA